MLEIDKAIEINIKEEIKKAPNTPGIYIFKDKNKKIIYVGKAKNLRKRLLNYTRKNQEDIKTQTLINNIEFLEFTICSSESEALILENNYIKQHKPKYNIVLRDDKTYPYIELSFHKYPRLSFARKKTNLKNRYFGPYVSLAQINVCLDESFKYFKLRSCTNSVFNSRKRPCLEYQIGRCSAPCVNKINLADYKKQVDLACLFLQGKNLALLDLLTQKMQNQSKNMQYELAAKTRDTIGHVSLLDNKQSADFKSDDFDVIGCSFSDENNNFFVFHLIKVINGKIIDNKNFQLKAPKNTGIAQIIEAKILQFYAQFSKKDLPKQIVLPFKLDKEVKLKLQKNIGNLLDKKILLYVKPQENKRRLLELANKNAHLFYLSQIQKQQTKTKAFLDLQKLLGSVDKIKQIQCIDISHTFGEYTYGSCVCFDLKGANKKLYRSYLIKKAKKSDDLGAIFELITRRFKNYQYQKGEILFIDGGFLQLQTAKKAFDFLKIKNPPFLAAIKKGDARKTGLEKLVFLDKKEISFNLQSSAFRLLINLRDESHRFALKHNQKKRLKKQTKSQLDNIQGIGEQKKLLLLKNFGSVNVLKNASLEKLKSINSIGEKLAKKIYNYFHK